MLTGEQFRQALIDALNNSAELLSIGYCHTWALDKDNKSVKPEDESACKWCMEGAFIASTVLKYDEETAQQIQKACVAMTQAANKEFVKHMRAKKHVGTKIAAGASYIPAVNDAYQTTQADVIRFVKRGAQLARLAKFN